MKKKIYTLIITILFGTTSCYSLSIDSILSQRLGDIGSALGLPNFTVQCNTGIENIDMYSMCGVFGDLSNKMNNDFNFAGCSISTTNPLDCQVKAMQKLCRALGSGATKYVVNSTKDVVGAGTELFITGGKVVSDHSLCNYVQKMDTVRLHSGKTLKQVYTETGLKTVREQGLFSSINDEIRDCLKVEQDKEKCMNPSEWGLPRTMREVEEKNSIASIQMNSKSENFAQDSQSIKAKLSNEIKKRCSDTISLDNCVKDVLSDNESVVKKRDAIIAVIETSSAIRLKKIIKANRGEKHFFLKGSEVIDSLSIEYKENYIDGVARENAFNIVLESLYKSNIEIEKESILLMQYNIVDNAEPFLKKASREKLKTLMDL